MTSKLFELLVGFLCLFCNLETLGCETGAVIPVDSVFLNICAAPFSAGEL